MNRTSCSGPLYILRQSIHDMQMTARRAVSPIIATLLLIAIAVAAGIIVYVFTNSLAGNLTQSGAQQVSDQVSMDAYSFPTSGSNACGSYTGPCVQLVLRNTGSSTVTFASLYYDANYCQSSGTVCTVFPTTVAAGTTCTTTGLWTAAGGPTCAAGQYAVITVGSPLPAAASAAGTSHLIRVVATDGGTFIFSVVAGRFG